VRINTVWYALDWKPLEGERGGSEPQGIHEPLSLEEGTLAEDNSLQAQAYLVLDRREEVRQAP